MSSPWSWRSGWLPVLRRSRSHGTAKRPQGPGPSVRQHRGSGWAVCPPVPSSPLQHGNASISATGVTCGPAPTLGVFSPEREGQDRARWLQTPGLSSPWTTKPPLNYIEASSRIRRPGSLSLTILKIKAIFTHPHPASASFHNLSNCLKTGFGLTVTNFFRIALE